MATYQVSGNTKEAGVNAANLVVVYKADRTSPGTIGEELGRSTANGAGNWSIQYDDWPGDVFVVALDLTDTVKYQGKVKDWVLGSLAGLGAQEYKKAHTYVEQEMGGSHFWILDEASGTLADEIGGVTLTLAGGAVTYAQPSIELDDSSIEFAASYTIGATATVSTTTTVAALIKIDNSAVPQTIFGFGATVGNGYSLSYSFASDCFGFSSFNSDVYGFTSASTIVADGNWHVVVAEFHTNDFASNRIWVDGIEQSLSQVFGTTVNRTISTNFQLGTAGNYVGGSFYEGAMSRACIVPDVLSDSQVGILSRAMASGWVQGQAEVVGEGNLISYWPMQSQEGTSLLDLKSSFDGTLTGTPTAVDGPFPQGGKALNFNGSNQYIASLGGAADFKFIHETAVFSLSFWMRLDLPDAVAEYCMVGSTPSRLGDLGFCVFYDNNAGDHQIYLSVSNGGGSVYALKVTWDNLALDADTGWHHYFISANLTTADLYLDGVIQSGVVDQANTTGIGNATRALNIGRANDSSAFFYFDGALDQFRIYSTNLGATEASRLFYEGGGVPAVWDSASAITMTLSENDERATDASAFNCWVRGTVSKLDTDLFCVEYEIMDAGASGQEVHVGLQVGSTMPPVLGDRIEYRDNGTTITPNEGTVGGRPTYTTGDFITVLYDNGDVWFGKNGSWITGDPLARTGPTATGIVGADIFAHFQSDNAPGSPSVRINAGQSAFQHVPDDWIAGMRDTIA